MRLPWNRQFSEEVTRFDLRYTCRDCAHYVERLTRCAHEWPLSDHLATHDAADPAAEVVFCKEFDLR